MEPQVQTQLLVMCGAFFAGLVGVLGAAVAALCYFLRRLVNTTIPEQGERFERVMTAQLRQCHEEHAGQEQRAADRHKEVMAALRPFGRHDYGEDRQR